MMSETSIPDISPILPGELYDEDYPMDEEFVENYELPFNPTGDDEFPY